MAQVPSIPIGVDPRVEFIGMVFAQTSWEEEIYSWGNYNHRDYPYFQEIKTLLTPLNNHPALVIAEQLVTEQRFIWDAIPAFILFHGNPPSIPHQRPYDSYIIGRAGREEALHQFAETLKDLAGQISFEVFYAQHADFYDQITSGIRCQFPQEKIIPLLETFFGWKQASYGVILAPCMFPGGGYGLRIPNGKTFDTFEVMRVNGIRDGMPYFGDAAGIFRLAVHEFAHSFINPTAEKWEDEILELRPLYEPIETQLEQNVSHNWMDKFKEQLVVAFTLFVQFQEEAVQDIERQIHVAETRQGLYVKP